MKQTKTWKWGLGLLAAAPLFVACTKTAPRVAHVQGGAAVPHAYATYALVAHPVNESPLDPKLAEQIGAHMARAGYAQAGEASADLHIQYGVLLHREPTHSPVAPSAPIAGVGLPDGLPPELPSPELFVASDEAQQSNRKVILVLASERATDQVVWMGVSSDDVSKASLEKDAVASVAQIMSRFPSRGGWKDGVSPDPS